MPPQHERITLERSNIECPRRRDRTAERSARDPHRDEPGETSQEVRQHSTPPNFQREGTPCDSGRATETVGESERREETCRPSRGSGDRIRRQLKQPNLDANFRARRCIRRLGLFAIPALRYPPRREQNKKDARRETAFASHDAWPSSILWIVTNQFYEFPPVHEAA